MRCDSVYSHGCCNVGHAIWLRRISSARMRLYTNSVFRLLNSSDLSSSFGSSAISNSKMIHPMSHRHNCTRIAAIPRNSHHKIAYRWTSGRQHASTVDGLELYSSSYNQCSTSRDDTSNPLEWIISIRYTIYIASYRHNSPWAVTVPHQMLTVG